MSLYHLSANLACTIEPTRLPRAAICPEIRRPHSGTEPALHADPAPGVLVVTLDYPPLNAVSLAQSRKILASLAAVTGTAQQIMAGTWGP